MITNKDITYYSKSVNEETRLEEWNRVVFKDVWVFGGKGSNINAGYENANDVNVRIPIDRVQDTSIFKVKDIIAIGEQDAISKQSDLNGKEYYNVTSITVNDFGNNPHVHLGGR